MYEKIVIPLDGSEQAEFILPYIEKLAGTFNSGIDLLVVSANHDNTNIHLLQKYLADIASGLTGKGLKTSSTFLPGNPGEEIINFTNKNTEGLLALASYGGSGASHWPLGDLTAKIITRTNSPILLVPEKLHPIHSKEPEFLRIVVPLDGSPLGAAALPYVKAVAGKSGSKLFLVDVLTSVYKTYGAVKYAADFEKQLIETLRNEAQEYFNTITPELEIDKIAFKSDIISGSPADSILRYAEENNADLIAISTHGRSGVKRFIMGSVTQQIIHSSDIPVLIIRAKN
jgi:nucleotide-binding universal stress UspA family protein